MARVDVFSESRSLGLVARDGIEPPTPAFSGPTTELAEVVQNKQK
jgi:hypothetical protein